MYIYIHSQTGEILNSRYKCSKSVEPVWYGYHLSLRSSRSHFFKESFSKLNLTKTVVVTMIANSEKMKKKYLKFFLERFYPKDVLRNCSCLTQFYGNFISPSKKVEALENYVCAVKNIWNNMTLFVCLRWSISRFSECF